MEDINVKVLDEVNKGTTMGMEFILYQVKQEMTDLKKFWMLNMANIKKLLTELITYIHNTQ